MPLIFIHLHGAHFASPVFSWSSVEWGGVFPPPPDLDCLSLSPPPPTTTTSSADPYPPAPPYRGFLSLRSTPGRRSAASSPPSASATSPVTGTDALFSNAPAPPSLPPGCARLLHHGVKNIPKAAATNASSFPDSYRAQSRPPP